VLVALTPSGRTTLGKLYGPLAQEGGRLLARFGDAELSMIRDFLVEATDVVDRQRARLRARQ
jgi:hypothetical protein